jgi:hypothetical protein
MTTVAARAGSLLYFDAAGDRLEAAHAPARPVAKERSYGT